MAKKNTTKSAAHNANTPRRHNKSGRKQTAKSDSRKDFVKERTQEPADDPKLRAIRAAARAKENGVHPGRYRRSGLDYLHSAIRAIENDANTQAHGQKLSREEKRAAVLAVAQNLHWARNHAINGDHNLAVESCNAALDAMGPDAGLKRLRNLDVVILDRRGEPQHTRAGEIIRRFRDKQMEGYELCVELLNARSEEAAEVIDRKMDPETGSGIRCELHLIERFQYESSSLVKRHPPRLVLRVADVKVRLSVAQSDLACKAS